MIIMPKIQAIKSKKKEKEYVQHVITIPKEAMDRMGWKEGDTVYFSYGKDYLILES